METTVFTPRLKLTLLTSAERGSPEFEWLHEMRSDAQVTLWSLSGQSKSQEDTERFAKACIPAIPEGGDGKPKTYKVNYAVHEILSSPSDPTRPNVSQEEKPTRFIGMVSIRSIGPSDLILPEQYTPASSLTPSTLSTEVAYQFLPRSWGRGLATEAVGTFLEVLRRTAPLWQPFEKVYVRAIVNDENPASLAVMKKLGLQNMGVWEWTGEAIWLAGKWTDRSRLWIFGKFLIE
ncbi:Nn.00g081830.m01.CDS01 [Neocucurbitaria sp. VM-36]